MSELSVPIKYKILHTTVEQGIEALLAFIISFTITFLIIPRIIAAAKKYSLIDKPNHRKVHDTPIPSFGGIAIFIGFFAGSVYWMAFWGDNRFIFLVISFIILFALGIIDDLKGLSASRKFPVQFLVAGLIAYAGIRIQSLYGLFGIYDIHPVFQYALTMVLIVGITNAFNLIDGIDGLAGGLAFINSIVLGTILILDAEYVFGIVSIALAGSLLAFLHYNFNPAKIFMGDTGSLIIGFSMAILGIVGISNTATQDSLMGIQGNLMIIIVGILLLPAYDTLRVFIVRIRNKTSPFSPDKKHIHHLLMETGYNHKKSAIVLYISNLIIIASAFLLRNLNPGFSVPVLVVIAVFLTEMLNIRRLLVIQIQERFLRKKADKIVTQNRLLMKNLKNLDKKK